MFNSEPIIEIFRDGKTLSVKGIMPTWNKTHENGQICVSIPLLGGIITHAMNEDDAEKAVNEAFQCFCIISEKHGMGLENELTFLGWSMEKTNSKNHSVLSLNTDIPAYDLMMDTGDTRVLEFAHE